MVGAHRLAGVSHGPRTETTWRIHTLSASLHGRHNPAPRVHDALAEGHHVVIHLVGTLGGRRDAGGLLQDLGDNREIPLEVALNGNGNVAEALEDRGLELVREGGALAFHISIQSAQGFPNKAGEKLTLRLLSR